MLKLNSVLQQSRAATTEFHKYQFGSKDLEWKWESQGEERHLILVTQVITKQEKQEKDDDIGRSTAGITDRDQEEMVLAGEMRNHTEWW